MFLVVLCAVLALALIGWLMLAGEGKSPESRRMQARIPLNIPVKVESFGENFSASSHNISSGGMLLQAEARVKVAQPMQLSFILPDQTLVEIPAVVCHSRNGHFGVRFDPTHYRRALVEKWVRHELEEHHRVAARAQIPQ